MKFLWAWTTLVKDQRQSLSHICGSKITLLTLDSVFSSVNEFQRSSEERTVWVCGSCQEPKPPSDVLVCCPQAQRKAQWNFPVGQSLMPESRKGPSWKNKNISPVQREDFWAQGSIILLYLLLFLSSIFLSFPFLSFWLKAPAIDNSLHYWNRTCFISITSQYMSLLCPIPANFPIFLHNTSSWMEEVCYVGWDLKD